MYSLPKIHKPGRKSRHIIPVLNAPCTKIARWLVSEFRSLPKVESCSVLNSIEFAKLITKETIQDDEVLVSFDVESLFPSIPTEHALAAIHAHLEKHKISPEKVSVYMLATKMCMDTNFFQYNGHFYKIKTGTSMGNPLSPYVAEAMMAKFEMDLKLKDVLPRFWRRYVDDVIAIIKRDELDKTLVMLNQQYTELKFTQELEENGCIAFLDLELQRNNGRIDIAVHHKDTSTLRLIPSDSFSPIQHKLAAFHSLAHRLVNLPLNTVNYKAEYDYIMHAAKVNGYGKILIDNIIKKHSSKKQKSSLSTLFSQNSRLDKLDNNKKMSLIFAPEITNGLKTVLHRNELDIVYNNPFKLKNKLNSFKDKKCALDKSGIYEITCKECEKKYYGQTKRSIKQRFKEHCRFIRNNEPGKSAFAAHALEALHLNVSDENIRLLKPTIDNNKLDAYESLYIHRDDNALNADKGNIESDLFTFSLCPKSNTSKSSAQ